MAQLIHPLPTLAFPGELNTLEFRANENETSMHLTLSAGGEVLLDTILYFDATGVVVVDDLASLLRDHVVKPTLVKIGYGANTAEVNCLPCAIHLSTPAIDFCKRNFLTRSSHRRVTTRSTVHFSFLPNEGDVVRYRLVTLAGESVNYHEWKPIAITMNGQNPVQFSLNMAEVLRAHLSIPLEEILCIEVEAMARKSTLLLQPYRHDSALIEFVNAFGVIEQVLFDHTSTEQSPERKATVEAGRRRVYHVLNVATTTATADLIPDEERYLYEDCILALSHWLADTQRSIVVTDAKMKDNSDASNTASVEIKFQTSSVSVEADAPRRIFDKTFDNTFN